MSTLISLGRRIKKLREQRGITQEKLADLCSTTSQYISSVERGRKNLTVQGLDKIAKALKVDLISLFAFDSTDHKLSKKEVRTIIDSYDEQSLEKALRIIQLIQES